MRRKKRRVYIKRGFRIIIVVRGTSEHAICEVYNTPYFSHFKYIILFARQVERERERCRWERSLCLVSCRIYLFRVCVCEKDKLIHHHSGARSAVYRKTEWVRRRSSSTSFSPRAAAPSDGDASVWREKTVGVAA